MEIKIINEIFKQYKNMYLIRNGFKIVKVKKIIKKLCLKIILINILI